MRANSTVLLVNEHERHRKISFEIAIVCQFYWLYRYAYASFAIPWSNHSRTSVVICIVQLKNRSYKSMWPRWYTKFHIPKWMWWNMRINFACQMAIWRKRLWNWKKSIKIVARTEMIEKIRIFEIFISFGLNLTKKSCFFSTDWFKLRTDEIYKFCYSNFSKKHFFITKTLKLTIAKSEQSTHFHRIQWRYKHQNWSINLHQNRNSA